MISPPPPTAHDEYLAGARRDLLAVMRANRSVRLSLRLTAVTTYVDLDDPLDPYPPIHPPSGPAPLNSAAAIALLRRARERLITAAGQAETIEESLRLAECARHLARSLNPPVSEHYRP